MEGLLFGARVEFQVIGKPAFAAFQGVYLGKRLPEEHRRIGLAVCRTRRTAEAKAKNTGINRPFPPMFHSDQPFFGWERTAPIYFYI